MRTKIYAAINRNELIRETSSSGGVFYELMKYVLDKNGVVFGATFDEKWEVVHTHAEALEECRKFLGSKYVQCRVGNEYKIAKSYLEEGRWVLFSGTPCQVSGIKAFLGKDYENFITVDFICHGVSSPAVCREYLKYVAEGKTIRNISFRDKTEGWIKFSLKIDFTDGSSYRRIQQEDLFMQGFLQDIYLRPSCYECRFKGIERIADFTLADYWGVQNQKKEMFDDRGTSLVMIHSAKGMQIWREISREFTFCEMDEIAFAENLNVFDSVSRPEKREIFYRSGMNNFEELKKLTDRKISIKQKLIKRAKNAVRKIIGGK